MTIVAPLHFSGTHRIHPLMVSGYPMGSKFKKEDMLFRV